MKTRLKEHNKKGYTLVELVVYLAISGIMVGMLAWGVISWFNYTQFKKQNENAQALFLSSQRTLTHMLSTGEITNLQKLVEEGGALEMSDVSKYGIDNSDFNGRIYYLIYNGKKTPGEYEPKNALAEKVFRLFFPENEFGSDVYDASIAIEFNPYDATVYSVFYCDNNKADAFSYNTDYEANKSGTLCIVDRTTGYRKARLIGYCYSDLLGAVPSNKAIRLGALELVNDEFLYLRFKVTSITGKALLQQLTYNITLCDATGADMLTIATTDSIKQNGGAVACVVTSALDETDTTDKISFYMYIDDDNYIYLILDAMDISTTVKSYTPADFGNVVFAESASIAKLQPYGLKLGNDISAKLYVRSSANLSSGIAKSNTENTLFASGNNNENVYTYNINCARHIFNIRYIENNAQLNCDAVYTQKKDITWKKTSTVAGTVSYVFDSVNEKAVNPSFVPIYALNIGNTYNGGNYSLINFSFTDSYEYSCRDGYPVIDANAKAVEALGLFCVNNGQIEKIVFRNVSVNTSADSGKRDHVGAVCGINNGEIDLITVKSGVINGGGFVGGIAGETNGDANASIINCSNESTVCGDNFVGGITGAVTSRGMLVSGCANYGYVSAREENGRCIGGITGYLANNSQVANCKAASKLANGYTLNPSEISGYLKGWFVGGIVGLNEGSITGSYTSDRDSSNRYQTSYVTGYRYVGGITGLNLNSAGLSGTPGSNASHVIGDRYVGGITGANASVNIANDIFGDFVPNETNVQINKSKNLSYTITGWENKGVVSAANSYAGGITGLNAGKIQNCSVRLDSSSALHDTAKSYGQNADCVGGIAGYNSGEMSWESDTTSVAVSVMAGRNYVGGIVGYNDQSGNIRNYSFTGGYVSGKNYVGGLAGLNVSTLLFDGTLRFNTLPNGVYGENFVGGVFGGVIIAPSQTQTNIDCNTDNFLGVVQASGCFSGGFVGYLENVGESSRIYDRVESLLASDLTAVISGGNTANGNTIAVFSSGGYNTLSSVVGNLYVGGVVGYCHNGTNLTLNGILNNANVAATGSVENASIGNVIDDDNGSVNIKYSYAGGIIGYVSEAVTVDNCSNADNTQISTRGTYTASLTEVNCGRVVNCTVNNFNKQGSDCIGGVAGINKGTIENCSITKQVRGGNYVGGIAVRNEGNIIGCTVGDSNDTSVDCAVYASGSDIGGVAAINAEDGNIQYCNVVKNINYSEGRVVESTAVGGIAGKNFGVISNACDESKNQTTTNETTVITEPVEEDFVSSALKPQESVFDAYNNAFVYDVYRSGRNRRYQYYIVVNNANLYLTNGTVTSGTFNSDVSSIINNNLSKFPVTSATDSITQRFITALKAYFDPLRGEFRLSQEEYNSTFSVLNEAAIRSALSGYINEANSDDEFYAFYNSSNNNGLRLEAGKTNKAALIWQQLWDNFVKDKISHSVTTQTTQTVYYTNSVTATVGGTDKVGGIAGVNRGFIDNSAIEDELFVIKADVVATTGSAGGVAGENDIADHGGISGCEFAGTVRSSYGRAAGIVTENKEGQTITNCKLSGRVTAEQNISGGIVAVNLGTVENCLCAGEVRGVGSIGGIAAENGDSEINAVIENCRIIDDGELSDTALTATGMNGNSSFIGGIVGINKKGSSVIASGGAENEDNAATIVNSNSYGAHVGGVAGLNENGAQITVRENVTGAGNAFPSYINIEFDTTSGFCGGVAGENLGSIYGYSVIGNISSSIQGLSFGTGGIAAVNGRVEEDAVTRGSIYYCFYSGELKAVGGSEKESHSYAAGICGLNRSDSTVSYCTIATEKDTDIINSYNYTAGIVGYNNGEVFNCTADLGSDNKAYIELTAVNVDEDRRGSIGGIVATNFDSGIVSVASNTNMWSVVNKQSNTYYTGGIIGLADGGRNVSYLTNYASVSANDYSGGVIGAIKSYTGNSGFVFNDLVNYGNVTATSTSGSKVVGGVVGYWQMIGGEIYNCENYGSVNNRVSSSRVGEIVGFIGISGAVEEHYGVYNVVKSNSAQREVGYVQCWGASSLVSTVSANNYTNSNTDRFSGSIRIGDVNFINGRYELNWSYSDNNDLRRVDYVEVEVHYYDEDGVDRIYETRHIGHNAVYYPSGTDSNSNLTSNNLNKMHFSTPKQWESGTRFYFKVTAVNGTYRISSTSSSLTYATVLYEPIVRFVAIGTQNGRAYGYMLVENGADLDELAGAGNWKVVVKESGHGINTEISGVGIYYSPMVYLNGTSGSDTFKSQAFSLNGQFEESAVCGANFYILLFNDGVSADIIRSSIKENGSSESDINISFTIHATKSYANTVFYRVELVDNEGTVYAEQVVGLQANQQNVDARMSIPENKVAAAAGKSLTLRWYEWQDDMVHYFHSDYELFGKTFNAQTIDGTPFYSSTLDHTNGTTCYGETTLTVPTQAAAPTQLSYTYNNVTKQYTFTWEDVNDSDTFPDANYTAKLTGIDRVTGTEREIAVNVLLTDKSWTVNKFNAQYESITLSVTRNGKTNPDGTTVYIANTQSEVFLMAPPLSAANTPLISLKDKNDLVYSFGEWLTIDIDDAANPENICLDYYVMNITDENNNVSDVIIHKEDLLYDAVNNKYYYEMDMESYAGKLLSIKVMAVSNNVNPANNGYSDSDYSTVTSIRVGTRLPMQNERNIDMQIADSELSDLTEIADSQFASPGFDITVTDADAIYDSSIQTTGHYELEVWVGNETARTEKIWDVKSMNGNLALGYINIGDISSKYAGMYAYIRVRAVSDSSISSLYSAEEDNAFGIVGWKKISLPKLKLSEIDVITYHVSSVASDNLLADWSYLAEGAAAVSNNVPHYGIAWKQDVFLAEYTFSFVPYAYENIGSTGEFTIKDALGNILFDDSTEFESESARYKISFTDSDADGQKEFKIYRSEENGANTVWVDKSALYTVADGDYPNVVLDENEVMFVIKDYACNITSDGFTNIDIDMYPIIVLSIDDEGLAHYELRIPDSYIFLQIQRLTEQVVIEGVIDEQYAQQMVAPKYIWNVEHTTE